ncbi:MAG: Coenzyme F420 hydrogenase/dehydrogenase, beta subunit C-terminal domain, partial [Promethearchaeota archaeon]
ITPQLEVVQKFHTYTSSLPNLRHYKFKKIALVGTPCQIYTIRCMQELGIIPSENIEICLGLFCYENFFFDKKRIEKFEKDFKLKFENIKRVNIKENLIINIKSKKNTQKIIHIPFEKLTDYTRPACSVCKDFTNIYADISFGGLGSQDKYTTVITRTKKGEEIINKALRAGVIKRFKLDSSNLKDLKEKLIQFAQLKLKRTKKNMRDKMLTWNSLSRTSIANK